ncbi:MAG: EAL domain-containing protein [Actinomycetota bacterium]|nr:EAL domain-containing protein [Actinomycetota bacterium]
MSRVASVVRGVAALLPEGRTLASEFWETRHRAICALLWAHVPALFLFGLYRGEGVQHSTVEVVPALAFALVAADHRLSRAIRSIVAALGLIVCSAVLVHLSGGVIEAHFHFFVMLSVISLYQDWRPFLMAIGFVALHHGLVGLITPENVYDHDQALRAPLKWAIVHAGFVLAASAVNVASWRIVEDGHRKSRAALEASERRFRALIEQSSDVVTVVDEAGTIVYDSPSSARVLGYGPEERIGRNGFEFVHPEDVAAVAEVFGRLTGNPGAVAQMELRAPHQDGTVRWLEVSVTNLLHERAVEGVVVNFRDITERKALAQQLAHQAFHDPLTGLANRALLLDRVEHALSAARRKPDNRLAVLYLDLDDFKTVNDGLGHEAGDMLLRLAAQRIAGVLRPGDTACRLGGDEFAVLLEDLPSTALAYVIGGRVLEELREPFELEAGLVSLNASLGIVVPTGCDEDAAALLRNADLAMYRAKGQGKGRFEIYEAGMHAAVVERLALKADLRRAVDAGEFEPHYQPIVDLQSGRTVGVEALVRWHHPERGLLLPAAFIDLAEETGVIVPIGVQVLRQACRDAAGWQERLGNDAPLSVSVNLSVRQLQHPEIVREVASALRDSGLPGRALVLEITESTLLDDTEAAATRLAELKALGVRMALDDFGTGYSSLSYLGRFPVDILKIDKSFVEVLGEAVTDRSALVAAIVGLGATLGVQVTAEGIEVADQLAHLQKMGCELGQGFYFARPVPAAELEQRLFKPAMAVTA